MSFKVCLFVVLIALSPAIDVAPAQRGSSSAEDVAGLFLGPAPGTSVSAWKARTPTATWQRYRGTLEQIVDEESGRRGVEPSGLWCAVATDYNAGVERVAVFFALRDTAPPACRLELVQGVARTATDEQAATLFQELTAVMTQRLGAYGAVDLSESTTPLPYGGGTGFPEGITRWVEGVRWHDDDRDVFLFRAARAVGFSSRSPLLTRNSEDGGEPNNVARDAEQRLADALGGGFPDAAAAMAYDFVPLHQAQIRRGLTQVLDARAGAGAQDQALLTFAADRLARKLWVEPPAPSQHRELAPLLTRGLRFVPQPDSELSVYDGALVDVVIRKWPETPWGQIAFVTHLYDGWTEGCDERAFAQVIRHGNRWLQSHPESPWRIAVITAVARAYETQWALNGAFTTDARQNARVVTAVEAAARRSAIRLYEELMRLAPASQDAAYAGRRIIQIRANMTTSQDAYSCVIP